MDEPSFKVLSVHSTLEAAGKVAEEACKGTYSKSFLTVLVSRLTKKQTMMRAMKSQRVVIGVGVVSLISIFRLMLTFYVKRYRNEVCSTHGIALESQPACMS